MEKGVNLLVDTNIWLERLLDQEKSLEVKNFLETIPAELLFISDFTLHSIGVILFRLKKSSLLHDFIKDLFDRAHIKVLSLNPIDQIDLIELNTKQKLDFDDAYQYQVALKYNLTLVTFDRDFKKSKIRVHTPKEATQLFKKAL
jgi:Predicted nucleic acid-binding protein, contains PIN domain